MGRQQAGARGERRGSWEWSPKGEGERFIERRRENKDTDGEAVVSAINGAAVTAALREWKMRGNGVGGWSSTTGR